MSGRVARRRGERRADTTLGLAQGLGWFSIGLGLASCWRRMRCPAASACAGTRS
ncbi:hypothetical protein [Dankookia sp. P2]|uniref:hypothetical protein n=1 Tax=Dankookia sp. P2 TaxID=3423955 RepID=UPI003D668634